jgi:cell wall-associated NlpC family hydrolase
VSRPTRHKPFSAAVACVCLALLTAASGASASQPQTGGAVFVPPPPPPKKARIVDGKALAPRGAPRRVKRVITAANRLIMKPYRYGGGHRAFTSRLDVGYDCSGSVSYALYGGRFLRSPLDSGDLMRWGRRGPGRWITVYASGGHAYIVVAGLRFDTSMHDEDAPRPGTGPRWSTKLRRSAAYVPRHPRRY